jgi:acetolactate synthase I/II/III large subunit
MTGDGGFNMSMGDLETARRLGANFRHLHLQQRCVKALQHSVFGAGNYQSSDLIELDYAVANAMGCRGIRVILDNTSTVIDIVVTRDPARRLPGVDNRTLRIHKGDRPV